MRGKAKTGDCDRIEGRITPAYAGKSTQILWNCFFDQDHPRLCGEKLKTAVKDGVYTGSPPPMRGKAGKAWQENNQSRITPAYAGKSCSSNHVFTYA